MAETNTKVRLYLLTDTPKSHMLQAHCPNTLTLGNENVFYIGE